jgi:hypothetical protein
MTMVLTETTIPKWTIRIRIADNDDPEKATEWAEFEIPLEPLRFADQGGTRSLGNPGDQLLTISQVAALRYMRDAISAEIRRLGGQ